MKSIIGVLAIVCLVAWSITAEAGQTIRVALIYGESGLTFSGASLELTGVRLAMEELNESGGVLGRQVELLPLDNGNTPLGSRREAQKAVAAGVTAVIGPSSSSHAFLAAQVLQTAHIPMISPFATSPGVTRVGNYIFRVNFTDTLQGRALAKFAASDLKAATAVLVTCSEERYSMSLGKIFKDRFTQLGKTVLWEGDYLAEATDFRDILETVRRLRPDIVFFPGYDRAAGFFLKQARNLGVTATFLGGDSWSDNMYNYGGTAIEGNYYAGPWNLNSGNPAARAFMKRYGRHYPDVALTQFGMDHDAVFLLADAIRRAHSLAPARIRDALAATRNFRGVTGVITMDADGDPIKPVVIFRFEKGGSKYVKTLTPGSKNGTP